jgi:hypothetical protein
MSDQNSQTEQRDKLRKQLQEKFGEVESIGIEPLLDEALEQVAGGGDGVEDICSWMWCSSNNEKELAEPTSA